MASSVNVTRRRVFQALTGTALGLWVPGIATAQEDAPTVTLENQTTEGDEITVAEIVTEERVRWKIHRGSQDFASGFLEGGQRLENETFELESEIRSSGEIWISLFPSDGGHSVAKDNAVVTIEGGDDSASIVGVTEIAAEPDAGFNYPYFLYVPRISGTWNENTPLLVHQNNSPDTTDDLSYHKTQARKKVARGSPSRRISDELGVPVLVPIIPRPRKDPVNWTHRTQGLDRTAMKLSEGPLERVDLQVIDMIDHARKILESESRSVQERVLLNGYSGSGKFAQRFTLLHPERVLAVTAGGLAGMPVLPREEAKGHELNYHVGIADIEELTGESIDLEALAEVPQYFYEGSDDTRDTIGHEDTWTDDDLERTALAVFGEDVIDDRFRYAESVYEEDGMSAEFVVYEDAGHEWAPVDDLIEFHRPYVPENEPESTTSETDDPETTTSGADEPESTTDDVTTEAITEPQTSSTQGRTSSQAPGLGLLSGLAGVVSAFSIGYQYLRSSEE